MHRAGFEVEGWDNRLRKTIRSNSTLGDALEADLSGFDFVWASPPCQAYSKASRARRNLGHSYPDLMAATRSKLEAFGGGGGGGGGPYIIENVPGAPMRCDIMLCGSMFGLKLVRHRIFETNIGRLIMTHPCQHPELAVCVVGKRNPNLGADKKRRQGVLIETVGALWGSIGMNRNELSQAIHRPIPNFSAAKS